ncbi:hypothetical protein Hamer_G007304 [Homarus americanus]|uniref:Uncharacterized protein n=1 Tax=Homarus americanus TaxID=6706 RepID=A0A8J5JX81_HOMAM|nr:hypothetical protein Hamer_G007304 [Homarus americanus]
MCSRSGKTYCAMGENVMALDWTPPRHHGGGVKVLNLFLLLECQCLPPSCTGEAAPWARVPPSPPAHNPHSSASPPAPTNMSEIRTREVGRPEVC